ncbi:MAG: malonyl-CoA decarboxylase [Candidatus Baltobacteraceae bacterium]|jgi:malonyl-CoA decarboxylase
MQGVRLPANPIQWLDAARSARAGARGSAEQRKIVARLEGEMRACLEARGGEVSARARAAQLGRDYALLDEAGREAFFRTLSGFALGPAPPDELLAKYRSAADPRERQRLAREVRAALKAPWVRLLTQFNSLEGGVKFLVDLRADLLGMLEREPLFEALDADLREILASWFDIGFLELRRVTWDAPAALLERLAKYEAVHEVRNWLDLKNRLDVDRRCFAFHHPAMPDEPLIFVEVALTGELSAKIAPLLDRRAPVSKPAEAACAIFYSISNCQRGLQGISFGNALIKRVVNELSHELPKVRTYATLSPVPGFAAWLRAQAKENADGAEARTLELAAGRGWHRDAPAAEALRLPLMRLCARYLLQEKRGERAARDPVEHFHLGNGARLERINWLSDTSAKGLRESFSLMVNYVYTIDQIDENLEKYAAEGRIASSGAVRDLAKARN